MENVFHRKYPGHIFWYGRQYRSALVIIGGDDYELYSCPADDTEKISKEKLLVQTYSDEIPTEIATEGNTLMSDSGSEMPARLHFVSYGNGSYIFKDKEVAQDGSYYGTGIREFCEGYQVDPQKLMDTAEAHKKIRIKMLRAYVKQNHLDIRYYKDYGWDPVALEK